MSCASRDELLKLIDGELSVNSSHELQEHLGGCGSCRATEAELGELLAAVAAPPPSIANFADGVLARVRAGDVPAAIRKPTKAFGRGGLVVALGGLAAVAAAVMIVLPMMGSKTPSTSGVPPLAHITPPARRSPAGAFGARGASDERLEQWVNLWAFRRQQQDKLYKPVKHEIRSDDHLAFGYLNAGGRFGYLMVVAIDAKGQSYWYYPAAGGKRRDPGGVSLQGGRHELPDEIQHKLAPGQLRLFGIFTAAPLKVSQVEAAIAGVRIQFPRVTAVKRLPLQDTAQITRLLEVVGDSP